MKGRLFLLLVVLLVAVAIRLCSSPHYLGAPAADHDSAPMAIQQPLGDDLRGSCTAFLALQGRSLLREGFAATGGLPLLNIADTEPQHFWYYDHHTPGVAWITSASLALFGDTEASARCVALLFSTLTTLLLAGWIAKHLGLGPACVAAAAHIFLPMGWYWGLHLNYEVPCMTFCLLFLTQCLGDRPTRSSTALAVIALVLGFFMDVVIAFAVLAVMLEECLRRRYRPAMGWGALLGLVGFLWVGWRLVQVGRHGHTAGSDLLAHLQNSTMLSETFAARPWSSFVLGSLLLMCAGWPLAILGFEFLQSLFRSVSTGPGRLLRASLLLATLNVVVPAIQASSHEYYTLYFQIPLCVAFALFTQRLGAGLKSWSPRKSTLLVSSVLSLLLVATGLQAELNRLPPQSHFPSAHRLGQELAGTAGPAAILLEPPRAGDPSWQLIVSMYYSGHFIADVPADVAESAVRDSLLRPLGLEDAPIWLARDRTWPGRGGVVPWPVATD